MPATSSAQANNSVPGGRLAHIHAGIKAAGGGHAVADAHLPGCAHIAIVIAFINDAAAARRFKDATETAQHRVAICRTGLQRHRDHIAH